MLASLLLILGLQLFLAFMSIDFKYFIFWLFIWVNAINKYGDLSESDFDIDSIPKDFDYNNLIPVGYKENPSDDISRNKINA